MTSQIDRSSGVSTTIVVWWLEMEESSGKLIEKLPATMVFSGTSCLFFDDSESLL